jgi:hypothetical protein
MTPSDGLTAEEVAELRKLLEVEKIRKKKVLYSQLMDGLDVEGFANLYVEDAICEWGPFGSFQGRGQIVERLKVEFAGKPLFNYLHMTTNLWVELTSPTSAVSRCYLHDVCTEVQPRSIPTFGHALYEEDWVKVDGDWKIRHHRIHWLWPERSVSSDFPKGMTPSAIG